MYLAVRKIFWRETAKGSWTAWLTTVVVVVPIGDLIKLLPFSVEEFWLGV